MKIFFPWFLAIFSGITGFLGYVGFNQFYLEWVFMVPLLWCIRDGTPGRAFLLGWVTGTVGHAGGFYWFSHTLTEFVGLNLLFSYFGLLLFAAYNGLTFAFFAWGVHRLRSDKGWSVWWTAPVIWTAIENIYPFIFPNYIGASQYMLLPLIQIADITGILGISFLVVWMNAMVYLVFERLLARGKLPKVKMAVFVVVIGITLVYGRIRIQQTDAAAAAVSKIKVAMIQTGQGGVYKHKDPWPFVHLHEEMTRAALESSTAGNVDLVIWPEAVLTQPLSRSLEKLPESLFDKTGKPLLFGAYSGERTGPGIRFYVSAVLVDEKLRVKGIYDKQILVPFGEYIPLGDMFPGLYNLLPYTIRFWPGDNVVPMTFRDFRFQVNICYEDLFPDLVRLSMNAGYFSGIGLPHAIINLTNDSWYGDTFEPLQHLANASFRAIENRRPLVRATNTGISAIVDPVGRLKKRSGQWTREVISGEVPMMTGRTLYDRFGNWLGAGSTLLALLFIILTLKKKKSGGAET